MPDRANSQIGRYILHEKLGAGGMGVVFRATDRLTGNNIAFKRVTTPTDQLEFGSKARAFGTPEVRYSLANEFQILASIRHPNIINVLDYGFTRDGHPYFTMEYLEDAQTIIEAGKGKSLETKFHLLIQLLSALAYLHRRNILHRDLKPANVLVQNGEVKVLDFGLSVNHTQAKGIVGTFTYMPPEVLFGESATPLSDLYVVGIIAYQLFGENQHPFDTESMDSYLESMIRSQSDFSKLDLPTDLRNVLRKMLAQKIEGRYISAEACIQDIHKKLGWPLPEETEEIRDSYLQAATFIGRQKELDVLTQALDASIEGNGSTWLVGGESGVGKSRLLQELRIRGLTRGAMVLFGQGMADAGGRPYQFWREPLRMLAVTTPMEPWTAGVLREIVPKIETLFQHPLPSIPPLEGRANQQRLLNEIVTVFHRQTQPILLILEDLQWAVESLEVLRWLNRNISAHALMIVASYRDDEVPTLPKQLPNMQALRLARLSKTEIARLSQAMLGDTGAQPAVVELLRNQTEGNIFFLIEVVRALAEEAGRLSEIAQMTLPIQVFPRGVQTIIQRRLSRVPPEAQHLLKLAAVAGRQLDLRLMQALAPALELDPWLTSCVNAAVIEFQQGGWQFTHDKLREGLLETLDDATRREMHHTVARSIETVYPSTPDQAAILAYHWQIAGNMEKERNYAIQAGKIAAQQFANDDALMYFNRALELTPENPHIRFDILRSREQVYHLLGQREQQSADLAELRTIASSTQDTEQQILVALRDANYYEAVGRFDASIVAAKDAITRVEAQNTPTMNALLAQGNIAWGSVLVNQGQYALGKEKLETALSLLHPLGEVQQSAHALMSLGEIAYIQADYAAATDLWNQAVEAYQQVGDQQGESEGLRRLGNIATVHRRHPKAHTYFLQALDIRKKIGDRGGEARCLNNLGVLASVQSNTARSLDYYQQSLVIYREIEDRQWQANALHNIAIGQSTLGQHEHALESFELALELCREMGNQQGVAMSSGHLAQLLFDMGNLERGRELAEEALQVANEIGDRDVIGDMYHINAMYYLSLKDYATAQRYFQRALDIHRELNQQHRAVEHVAGLAKTALEQGNVETASAHTDAITAYLPENPHLHGSEYTYWILYVCWEVLTAQKQDGRAQNMLLTAYQLLLEEALHITDPTQADSFWNRVPIHRAIAEAYASLNR